MTIMSAPWVSIIPNIFAGLLTGLVITLISSYKEKAVKDTEYVHMFLDLVRNRYIETNNKYKEYMKSRYLNAGEYFDAIYDLVEEMQSIEDFLSQMDKNTRLAKILGKKPSTLFEEGMDYSFSEQQNRHKLLIDFLDSTMNYNEDTRKQIEMMIMPIRRAHRVLIRKVANLISDTEEQKVEIETTIP